MIKKQVTPFHATSVYDIDVNKLVELDVKYAFVDLDNTLAQFDLITPEKRTYELVKEFKEFTKSIKESILALLVKLVINGCTEIIEESDCNKSYI